MDKTRVIVEISGGSVVALHSNEDVDFHLIDWDNRGEEVVTWERSCKTAYSPDRLVDKNFDYYMNEVLSS